MVILTERQIAILKAIIEEYIASAVPVGSEPLERKYNLGVSPATIRNEMALLVQYGFLKQPHTSAGRIPTAISLRMYIKDIMQEAQISVSEEVSTRERVWDHRHNPHRLLQESAKALSHLLKTVSIAATDQHSLYSSGFSYILSMPEFYDIDVTRQVLSLLDEGTTLMQWFHRASEDDEVHILFGEELNHPFLSPVSFVFSTFPLGSQHQGMIGAIGPNRLNFPYVVPRVRFFAHLLQDLSRSW